MIYLSALRVVSAKNEEEGINALMYDVAQPVVRQQDGTIDLRRSIRTNLGSPTRALTSIRPGGNRVRTYLDVVLADSSESLLQSAIDAVTGALGTREPPVAIGDERYAVEFNTETGLFAAAPGELAELGAQLAALLRADARVWTAERSPLVVEVEEDEDVVSFGLDAQSVARVRATREPSWRAPRIRLEHAVFGDFEAMLPDTWGEIARMLTGLGTERLLDLGGIRYDLVRPDAPRRTLVEWPERALASTA